ncbi:hypothetical protein MASR1M74_28730 [Lentimicrobium sp.]
MDLQTAISRLIKAELYTAKRATGIAGFNTLPKENDTTSRIGEEPDCSYSGGFQRKTIEYIK